MTDYSELVKKLRDLHRDPRPASAVWLFDNQVALYDAAAAIEELQAKVDRLTKENRELAADRPEMEEVNGHWEWKNPNDEQHMPKLDEIVRCKECIHFTQSGWCDREFDWFPVDEDDFCSMAKKMEVRDA